MRSYAGIPGAILSCNVVATRGFSRHNYVTEMVNKQVKGKILSLIRDQRTKKQRKVKSLDKGGPLYLQCSYKV